MTPSTRNEVLGAVATAMTAEFIVVLGIIIGAAVAINVGAIATWLEGF